MNNLYVIEVNNYTKLLNLFIQFSIYKLNRILLNILLIKAKIRANKR